MTAMARKVVVIVMLLGLLGQTCWAFGELFHCHAQLDATHDAHQDEDHGESGANDDDAPTPHHHGSCTAHSPIAAAPQALMCYQRSLDAPCTIATCFKPLLLTHRFDRPDWFLTT